MSWYWVIRHRNYRLHPEGIAQYSDKAVDLVVADAHASLQSAQESISKRLATCKVAARIILQKWNKLRDLGHSNDPFASPIAPEAYESLRRQVARDSWVLLLAVLGEVFLNYLALMIIIPGRDPLLVAARCSIAALMTIATFKVFHKTIEVWMPGPAGHTAMSPMVVRVSTGVLALATLVSIAGISIARARDFEGGGERIGIVGVGFILLSLILPIVGGAIDLGLDSLLPPYRRLRKWRAALKDLRRFEGQIHRELAAVDKDLEEVQTDLQEQAGRMHAGVLDFRVSKDNLDAKRGKERESVAGTTAESSAKFRAGCAERFEPRMKAFIEGIQFERNEVWELVRRAIEPNVAPPSDPEQLGSPESESGGGIPWEDRP